MEYIQRKIFQRLDISVPFGNAIVLVFLITQFFDGASTYIGLRWGIITEINPLICWLISVTGISIAIAVAKIVAIGLGIMLHLINAHNALANMYGYVSVFFSSSVDILIFLYSD